MQLKIEWARKSRRCVTFWQNLCVQHVFVSVSSRTEHFERHLSLGVEIEKKKQHFLHRSICSMFNLLTLCPVSFHLNYSLIQIVVFF